KPDPSIYQLTLNRLGRRPEEAVFIDDSARNIMAARELGMHAIHFNATMDVPAELAKIGVRPEGGEDSG
ncbi:MAG TPA: HAD-IA family hydrolase, partial [Anaerolineae bacterium]